MNPSSTEHKPLRESTATGLWIAGGLALGVTAALILPRRRKGGTEGALLSRTGQALLGIAGEVGLAIAIRALSHAGDLAGAEAERQQSGPQGSAVTDMAPSKDHAITQHIAERFPALSGIVTWLATHRNTQKSG